MTDVKVPDIGDFSDVPVIEILVEVGQEVAVEDPLVTLESDKATMDVPSPAAGIVKEILVSVGDKVSEGTAVLRLEETAGRESVPSSAPEAGKRDTNGAASDEAQQRSTPPQDVDVSAQVLVIGGGPGGYTAAFRAADLGLKTVLVERHSALGGVCLNVGCIPSKALLHIARVIADAEETAEFGVRFGEPEIDVEKLRSWKASVVDRLTGGLSGLARQRKVEVITGEAKLTGPNTAEADGRTIGFEHCIIAVGSAPATLPFVPDDPRVIDSTGALELEELPERLLVIGGGIIGLEMATVYDALGSKVTVVELMDQLIPGCDPDLVKPLAKRIGARYEGIHLKTKVTAIEAKKDGLHVEFDTQRTSSSGTGGGTEPSVFDRVLVAVGRRPNGASLAAEAAGVQVDERGFIAVDDQLRTNVRHIFAIGDVVGEPMLAHKAMHEGRVAAEVAAGHDARFDARTIPSVAYTDPEVAWMGLTETRAKAEGIEYERHAIPWAASGRALTIGRSEGMTKLLTEPGSGRVLGMGITGINAGELLAEAVLALEMGAVAEDLAATVHAHPTLSETVAFAAEAAEGTITDLYMPRRSK